MPKFVLDRRERKMPVNPSLEFAKSVLEEAQGCDEVISIGGGSTIDVGKYVSCFLGVKHTAIPTTAGSGSEVTRYVVLTNGNGRKDTLMNPGFLPDKYVLNPNQVTSLPDLQTLSSGMDAVSHALESLWSANATRESGELGRLALGLAMANLRQSREKPKDLALRTNMLVAANLAGRAINITGTNVCHAVSYALTQLYNIPHGIACALTLAEWIRFFPSPAHETGAAWVVVTLAKSVLDPISIDIRLVADGAMQYEKIQTGSKRVTLQDVRMILEKSLCT